MSVFFAQEIGHAFDAVVFDSGFEGDLDLRGEELLGVALQDELLQLDFLIGQGKSQVAIVVEVSVGT